MAPKKGPKGGSASNNGSYVGAPTAQEVELARKVLREAADPKAKERAVLANMKYWLDTKGLNKKYENLWQDTMNAKGEERYDYLEDFLILQAREKKAAKDLQQTTRKTVGVKKRHHQISGWMSSYLILPYITSSHLISSYRILSYCTLPYTASAYLILS